MKLKFIAAAALIGLAASAGSAQETVEDKAKPCAACHGENGIPLMPEVPNIWGQHTGYLYIQLKDFKSKLRASEIMYPIVAELEKDDMLALARYFQEKPWPSTGYDSEAADINKAEPIDTAGMCSSCHLLSYFGDSTIPRLAGQTQTYLERTLLAFKTSERNNNADKSFLMRTFADEDLKIMSRYLAGL